jgi:uncharacterized membrane protein YedE/YeeE
MRASWVLLPIVVVLAILSWISGMDTTGDASTTWFLWAATVIAGTVFGFFVTAGK